MMLHHVANTCWHRYYLARSVQGVRSPVRGLVQGESRAAIGLCGVCGGFPRVARTRTCARAPTRARRRAHACAAPHALHTPALTGISPRTRAPHRPRIPRTPRTPALALARALSLLPFSLKEGGRGEAQAGPPFGSFIELRWRPDFTQSVHLRRNTPPMGRGAQK